MFVTTEYFWRDKHTFVVTKNVFCRDKNVFVATGLKKVCRDKRHVFRDKTLVRDTNDTYGSSSQ